MWKVGWTRNVSGRLRFRETARLFRFRRMAESVICFIFGSEKPSPSRAGRTILYPTFVVRHGKERLEGDSPSQKTRSDDEKTAVFPLAVVVAGDGSCARSGRGSRFDGLLPGDPLRPDRDGQRPDRSGSDVPVFPELLDQVRFAEMLPARRRRWQDLQTAGRRRVRAEQGGVHAGVRAKFRPG